MKVGFFHDSPMTVTDGKYYSRTLTNDVWLRYLTVFDEIQVSTRIMENNGGGVTLSSRDRVTFAPITEYSSPFMAFRNFPALIKQIREALSHVDGAIVRLPSIVGWLTFAVAKSIRKPILVELVGCPWDAYRMHSFGGKLFAPFAYLFTRFSLQKSDFAIYVTQSFLQKRYPTRGLSSGISNVNVDANEEVLSRRLTRITDRTSSSKALGAPIVVGGIGKIDLPYKGFESAVKAVDILVRSGLNIQFEIVGPGDPSSLDEVVRKLGLEEKVILKGPLASAEVQEWLESIDLYIHPSFTEGVSRASIEALSKGLPLILSAVGGQPELVDPRFLFEAGDSDMLATKILDLLKTEDLREIASSNFDRSREYSSSLLQERREGILRRFRSSF